ncbi:ankyrin repeat domain-containing protein [Bacillus cereus group sp. N21]|uniref:ankyrin repeat domain-containing protein n=1 Tax=Bacillus cereus group sp. N21 TaxID=2794591 RepID=UPI0018F3E128|nr:ankyrin repeat domain-containing protein [Bacillus cereus group sp. N21]MBJ8030050.1 ankyrin repeat domain-containing protein [Bacillus cereus group sp. N21]
MHEVKQLIGNEKEILNTMTSFGTWLHVAVKKGHLEIVKYLIEKGIDIDARGGTFDASALNVAAGAGHLEIVKYLIEVGAELDVSLAKRNPLFGAIYGGHKEVAEFVVGKGIDISIRYTGESIQNMDAYEYAIEFGQTEIAEYLKGKLEKSRTSY